MLIPVEIQLKIVELKSTFKWNLCWSQEKFNWKLLNYVKVQFEDNDFSQNSIENCFIQVLA